MHVKSKCYFIEAALALCALAAPATASAQQSYPKCTQDHPGRSQRALKFPAVWGDTRVLKSVASHTVKYAIVRYGIQDLVQPPDIEHATKEMYDFFSWKYGNPTLVASQWVTAGYQHFDHHADEAAAALLGMELPGPGAQVRLPKELTQWLHAQVDTAAQSSSTDICGALGDTSYVGIACVALIPILREAGNRAVDRLGISNAALIGQNKYDVTDAEIERLKTVRRQSLASTAGAKPASILRTRPKP